MRYGNTILFLVACLANGYMCGSENFSLGSSEESRSLAKKAVSSKRLATVREETPEDIALDKLLTLCDLLGKGVSLVPMSEYTDPQPIGRSALLHVMPVLGAPSRFSPNNAGAFLAGSLILGICKGGK